MGDFFFIKWSKESDSRSQFRNEPGETAREILYSKLSRDDSPHPLQEKLLAFRLQSMPVRSCLHLPLREEFLRFHF